MQLEFFDVPSPCIGVCQSDEKGYCQGCKRTRDERQNWLQLSSDDKQKVIKRCLSRKKRQQELDKPKIIAIEPLTPELPAQASLLDPPVKKPAITADDLDFGDFEL
jgi:uncharacterized protein